MHEVLLDCATLVVSEAWLLEVAIAAVDAVCSVYMLMSLAGALCTLDCGSSGKMGVIGDLRLITNRGGPAMQHNQAVQHHFDISSFEYQLGSNHNFTHPPQPRCRESMQGRYRQRKIRCRRL